MKKYFEMFLFIIKVTFLGYGGGNAMMPIIRKEAVVSKKWISNKEFDEVVIVTNMIPGPSVMEALAYISMKKLGKMMGSIIAFIAILPHLILPLGLYIVLATYAPEEYIFGINLGVMPVIIGLLLTFAWRYFKASTRELNAPIMWALIVGTITFTLFTPSPFNVPAIIMVVVMLFTYIVGTLKDRK